jgi:hypothetical protein
MNTDSTTYKIRVNGHLDDHWSAWLGELDMTRDTDGTTTVTVSIADQTQLHGVLTGLRDIGAVITDVRRTDAPVGTRRSPSSMSPTTPTRRRQNSAGSSIPPTAAQAR